MTFLITLLVFILIMSVLVLAHELGHFLAAKRAGILVEEFGFGLPPRIWGKKIGETLYSLNAFPFGGFVKLYGEELSEPARKGFVDRAFFEKSFLNRLSVLLAGVLMNIFLAVVIFSVIYYLYGIPARTDQIMVVGLAENSPAAVAGLRVDDRIVAVDGEKVAGLENFIALAGEKAGQVIELTITREGSSLVVDLVPRENPPEGEGPLGVAISDVELKKYPWYQMPYLGAREGIRESLGWSKLILSSMGKMFSGIFAGQVPKDLAGPIGVFQITGEAVKNGPLAVAKFLAIFSVNLAIFNILPFPALDGGRLVFLAYEFFTRKRADTKVEATVNTVGLVFLLSLMFLITINDILRLIHN